MALTRYVPGTRHCGALISIHKQWRTVHMDLDPKLCDQLEVLLTLEAPYTSSFTLWESTARGMAGCDQVKS